MPGISGGIRISWTKLLAIAAGLLAMLIVATNLVGQQVGQLQREISETQHRLSSNEGTDPRPGDRALTGTDTTLWISSVRDAAGSARFQQYVFELLDRHGAELARVEAISPRAADHPTRLRLDLSLRIKPSRLRGMLKDLERSEPLVLIDKFDLKAAEQPDAVQQSLGLDDLLLKIELSAFAPIGFSS